MKKSKPFQMPESIWRAAEQIARDRRKLTGEMCRWTDVIHKILNRYLLPRNRKKSKV